jgi:hypothetical protein
VHALFDAGLLAKFATDLAHAGLVHRPARFLAWKQPIFRLTPAPIDSQQLQKLRCEHHLSGKFSFAFAHQNQHPLAVYIADLQLLGFFTTQSGAVKSCQQCPMLQVRRRIQEGGDFLSAQDGRQRPSYLGLGDLLRKPRQLERACVKNFNAPVR